ncbi:MAG: PH domain-containing protein [Haloarculaceae archaeon]
MSDGDVEPDEETGPPPEEGTEHPDGTAHRGTNGEEAEDGSPVGPAGAGPADGPEVSPEEIDVEALTGPARRLDPRVRYVWVLGSVVGSLVLGGIAGVFGFLVLDRPLVGPAVFLFALGLGAVFAVLRYRSWSYEVREDSLYLERGVLTHTRTVVPYVRIQHVDASRGPVERLLGLATAVVYTAGSRGADVSVPGLTTDRADDLQERLKQLAIAAEGEDAV